MFSVIAFIRTCSVDSASLEGFHAVENIDRIHGQKKRFMILRIETPPNKSREFANGTLVVVVRDTNTRYWLVNDTSGLYAYANAPQNCSWVLLDSKEDTKSPLPESSSDIQWGHDVSSNRYFTVRGSTNIVDLTTLYESLANCNAVLFVGNKRTYDFYKTSNSSLVDDYRSAVAAGEAVFIAEDDDFDCLGLTHE